MNRLKQLRTEHGLSMREVANRINVPYTTYVNYEKGVRDPSTEVLGKLAKFFETTVDYLLGISDNVSVNNFKLPEIEETDNGLVFSFGGDNGKIEISPEDANKFRKIFDKKIPNLNDEYEAIRLKGEIIKHLQTANLNIQQLKDIKVIINALNNVNEE